MKGQGVLVLAVVIYLFTSCRPRFQISNLKRSDITSVTMKDCLDKEYPVASNELLDQLWHALVTSNEGELENLRNHRGYARVWIHRNNAAQSVYLEVVASNIYGPVVICDGNRAACSACEEFFKDLKVLYPDFNWCEVPN